MSTAEKIDLKKTLHPLYSPPANRCVLVTVPPLQVLAVDGQGDPNTAQAFQDAVQALYALSYTLKFALKARGGTPDYGVMPLEALWWLPGTDFNFEGRKDEWMWRAFIVQPDFVLPEQVEAARQEAARKKNPPALARVRFERFEEGLCAQTMHIGPYAAEGPTIARLHAFIVESGHRLTGRHHEIYLSDPARSAPEKMKTVIRQPAAPAEA